MILIPLASVFLYYSLLSLYKKIILTNKKIFYLLFLILYCRFFIMSDTNKEKKQENSRPLGAVLGWLNLSPTLPDNQDNMTGATAGLC